MGANRKAKRAMAKRRGLGNNTKVMDLMEAEAEKYLTEEEYNRLSQYEFNRAKQYILQNLTTDLSPYIAESLRDVAEQARRQTLAACAKVIMERGGYLHRLETREEHFYEAYIHAEATLSDEKEYQAYYDKVEKLELKPIKVINKTAEGGNGDGYSMGNGMQQESAVCAADESYESRRD